MHSPFLPQTGSKSTHGARIIVEKPRSHIEPVPRTKWPIWAIVAEQYSKLFFPGDIGVGDTIVHMIGDARSERFKLWFQDRFGKSCGCTERQRWLNRRFPYQIPAVNHPLFRGLFCRHYLEPFQKFLEPGALLHYRIHL